MPIGFFDKYFNEDDNEHLVLLHNARNKDTVKVIEPVVEEEEKLVLVKDENKVDAKKQAEDMKSRILQAAQQYMDEEEEDINENHAVTKMQLTELEKFLPGDKNSGKKSKKAKEKIETPALSDAEMMKLKKDIKKIKEKLSSLEADWDFDKKKAEELYAKKKEIIAQEIREKQMEERIQMKKMQEEKKKEEVPEKEEEDDEDEGGLFSGLMLDDEESTKSDTVTTGTAIQWKIVDLNVPKTWMGRYPKDLLLDFCNKQKLGKQNYNSNTVSGGIWRSSLKIVKDGYSSLPLTFELPQGICASNRHDAEQLMALYALFELDSNSSVFKVLPNAYKDLWTAWLEEKVKVYIQ